jgi:hypothetical protein
VRRVQCDWPYAPWFYGPKRDPRNPSQNRARKVNATTVRIKDSGTGQATETSCGTSTCTKSGQVTGTNGRRRDKLDSDRDEAMRKRKPKNGLFFFVFFRYSHAEGTRLEKGLKNKQFKSLSYICLITPCD